MRVCSPKRPKQQDPSSCPLWVYIVGDTLHHQQIGIGHMNVPFHLDQWGSPTS